jgi:hypothetical protein
MNKSASNAKASAEGAFQDYVNSKREPGSVGLFKAPSPSAKVESPISDKDKELFRNRILENLHSARCYDTSLRSALTVLAEVACEHPLYQLEITPLISYVKLSNDVHDHFRRIDHPRRYAAWQRFVSAQFLSFNFHLIAAQTGTNTNLIKVSDLEAIEQHGLFRSSQDPRWVGLPMQVQNYDNVSRGMSCGDLISINQLIETKLKLNHSDNEFIWKVIVSQCIEEISDFTIMCKVSVSDITGGRQLLIELLDRATSKSIGVIGFSFLPENGEFKLMDLHELTSIKQQSLGERESHPLTEQALSTEDTTTTPHSGKSANTSAGRLPIGW